jgi:hypothetical protein
LNLNPFKDKKNNAIHTAPKDLLHVPIRPNTSSRGKKVKKTFNELIQDILVLFLIRLTDSSLFSLLTRGLILFFLIRKFTLTSMSFNPTVGSNRNHTEIFRMPCLMLS